MRRDAPREARDGRGGGVFDLAAVVGIGRGHVVVARAEFDAARARAQEQAPVGRGVPLGLREGSRFGHAVGLVAPQLALDARRGARGVAEPAALFLEPVGVRAGDERERPTGQAPAPGPARVDARIRALEVDHATRMQRACLHRDRDRLELLRAALAAMQAQPQRIGAVERVLDRGPELRLVHALPRVEEQGRRGDRARVAFVLLAREAEGILRVGHVDGVADHGNRGARARLPAQDRVRAGALGGAVLAVAAGLEAPRGHGVAERAGTPARDRAQPPRVEAAEGRGYLRHRRGGGRARDDVDDAPGRVAVKHRERAAQDLDPPGRGEVDVRDLGLAVGQGGGNPVHDHAQPAYPEGRARAEAADRDLQVLRVVLAVVGDHARERGQRFRQVHLQLARGDALRVDHVHRGGHVLGAALGAGSRHHDRLAGHHGLWCLRPRRGAGEKEEGGRGPECHSRIGS